MSLENWLANGWLRRHDTSRQEIQDLLAVTDRALGNAVVDGLTADARIGLVNPAVLAIGAAGLAAAGYRPAKDRHHERVIDSLLHTVRTDPAVVARLHRFRRMRNEMTYERVGTVTEQEAAGFTTLVRELRSALVAWLTAKHPALMPPADR